MLSQTKRHLHKAIPTNRVVISGMGVVTPIGLNLKEAWNKILNRYCGIELLEGEDYEKLPCRIAAKIIGVEKLFQEKFSNHDLKTMAPSTAMAMIAAKEALEDAKWYPTSENDKINTGVSIGIGMVDLNDICRTSEDMKLKGYKKVSPYFVPRILANMAAGQISIKYGLRGPNHSVSTACATGAHSIGDGFRFIQNGDAKIMICGGAESCICPLSIAAFSRLRALATNFNNNPKAASRPFDKHRNGFVMGEGSGILVLEELNHALNRNANIYAEVIGYGLSGDGTHLTAPSDDGLGAKLSMQRALKNANILPEDVGYVNAHATSTPLGDAIEAKAIMDIFGSHAKKVKISSTKGSHGHLLGAAGNLESIFTIMAIYNDLLPPNVNLDTIEETMKLNFVKEVNEKWITNGRDGRKIALKNAFGFGGTNATLCFAEFKSK